MSARLAPRRVDWYPDRWLTVTFGMTAEQIAVYVQLVNLIYSRRGYLPDDDRANYRWLAISLRRFRAVKAELIALGKIEIVDGYVAIAEPIIPEPPPPLHRSERMAIVERDGEVCRYCGSTEGPFEIDHIRPRSRGGSNLPINLGVSCRDCNRDKGAKTVEEWLGEVADV